MTQKRVNLFGLFIDDMPLETAIERAERALEGGGSLSFITPNLEILHGARVSEGTRSILNSADIALPDGVGLCIAALLLRKPLKNRVAGIEFGEGLLSLCAAKGARVYLLGGKDKIAEEAAEKLRKKHPKLIICGARDGYFSENELVEVCADIDRSAPDVLIVCRGFPRQEKFVEAVRSKDLLPSVKVFACLGGSLDVWADKTKRAPLPFRRLGLEWLWRIAREPYRAERFLLSLPTLRSAFGICIQNCFAPSGIKEKKGAYNQVKTQASRR